MPGVPPDAVNTLKKAFKGLFKRGKKSKQDQDVSTEQTPPTTSTSSAGAPVATEGTSTNTANATAGAPQIPPVQSTSPLQSLSEDTSSKPLPPTHPLSTGQHTEPQEAVPQNYDAEPGPPTGAVPPAPVHTADLVREEQERIAKLDPSTATHGAKEDVGLPVQTNTATMAEQPTSLPDAGTTTSPVSTAENSDVLPSSKIDSGVGATQVEDNTVPDIAKENTQPPTNGVPVTTEEKVPTTQDEPPPIKPVKAVPGMSATSGPLEDFPQGGDVRDDELDK